METVFYISALVAVAATVMVITRKHAVHALLYLVVSLLAAAMVFYTLGAAFAAALEVIVYAGAVMVLFVFMIMMLNLGRQAVKQERQWLPARAWAGPAGLGALLLGLLIYAVWIAQKAPAQAGGEIEPQAVGLSLMTTYVLGVELSSMLLLSALVGVLHLARQKEAAP